MNTKCSPLSSKLRAELKRTKRQRDEAKQLLLDDLAAYEDLDKELQETVRETETLRHRISELEAAQNQAETGKEMIRSDAAESESRRLSTRIDELTKREALLVQELNNERQAAAKLRDENAKLGELMADGMQLFVEMHSAIGLLRASLREEQATATELVSRLPAKLEKTAQAALEKPGDEASAILPDQLDDLAAACIRLSNTLRKDQRP